MIKTIEKFPFCMLFTIKIINLIIFVITTRYFFYIFFKTKFSFLNFFIIKYNFTKRYFYKSASFLFYSRINSKLTF